MFNLLYNYFRILFKDFYYLFGFYKRRKFIPLIRDLKRFIKIKFTLYKPPILIVGCARSGTTLLASILSAHPIIIVIPYETRVFSSITEEFKKKINLIVPFPIHKLYDFFFYSKIKRTANRWCEKTPKNVTKIDQILKYFGTNVKIIHIIRDGRDVVTSLGDEPSTFWVSLERWINDVKAGLKFKNHPQVLTIKYEDLVLKFETTIAIICNFLKIKCGKYILNWSKYNVEYYRDPYSLKGRKMNGLYANSIGRWKNFENNKVIKEFMENPEAISLLNYLKYK